MGATCSVGSKVHGTQPTMTELNDSSISDKNANNVRLNTDNQSKTHNHLEQADHGYEKKDTEEKITEEVDKDKYPHLEKRFALIDTLIESASDNQKRLTETFNIRSLTLLNFESYISADRRILGDYMAQVGAADVLKVYYERSLQALELPCLTKPTQVSNKQHRDLVNVVMIGSIVWNNSDASLAFGEAVARSGILKYFVEVLKATSIEDAVDDGDMSETFEAALSILQNCSRSPTTRPILRNLDVVIYLLPFLKIDSDEGKMQALFTLANLVDETQNTVLLADDSLFDLLFSILNDAMADEDHRHPSMGFSVEEMLDGMTGLAKNDTNKVVLVRKGAVEVLVRVLQSGSDDEKEFAVKCLWELAFQKDNKQMLCNNKELVDLLTELQNCPHKATAKATERALWVINMKEKPEADTSLPMQTNDSGVAGGVRGHIMLSYQWSDQTMNIQIRDSLRENGYRVWMDIDNMEGSTLQAMAEAVQDASVILVCMSERYKLSQNCRSEAEYAFSMEKKIVPLLMERGYKPDGWLGIIKGAKLFFDFSGKYSFQQKIMDLQKEIGNNGKFAQIVHDIPDGEAPIIPVVKNILTAARGPDVVRWSTNDVQNWLTKNKLKTHPKLLELKGETMLFLRDISRRAPEFYFNYLKNDLKLDLLEDLMKFSRALDKL